MLSHIRLLPYSTIARNLNMSKMNKVLSLTDWNCYCVTNDFASLLLTHIRRNRPVTHINIATMSKSNC